MTETFDLNLKRMKGMAAVESARMNAASGNGGVPTKWQAQIDVKDIRVARRVTHVTAKDLAVIDDLGIPLTITEQLCLAVLYMQRGYAVRHADLISVLPNSKEAKSAQVYVCRIRKLIPEDWRIETVRGVGYRLVVNDD